MLHLQPEIIKVRKYLTNSSNPWSLSGMKTEFGGYGYGSSAASGMRTTASSHLSPYTSLPPIPAPSPDSVRKCPRGGLVVSVSVRVRVWECPQASAAGVGGWRECTCVSAGGVGWWSERPLVPPAGAPCCFGGGGVWLHSLPRDRSIWEM